MKRIKKAKIAANGVMLAALAAIGVAAFQMGNSSQKEEIVLESEEENETADVSEEEEMLEDAGTSQVEADMSADDLFAEMETEDEKSDVSGEESYNEVMGEEGNSSDVLEEETADTSVSAIVYDALDFSEDTIMEWPVDGNILLDYSMDQTIYFPTLDQYKVSPAIAVQAEEGTPVAASADGKVFSIEDTAQTGTTVTMELGNGYQAIYGQLTNLQISEGETVKKGTTIGYINAPTKYYSTEGSCLYFAMKRNGESIDPILYLP